MMAIIFLSLDAGQTSIMTLMCEGLMAMMPQGHPPGGNPTRSSSQIGRFQSSADAALEIRYSPAKVKLEPHLLAVHLDHDSLPRSSAERGLS
ncbi:hypothetical protein MJO28_001557 [Puccinia striiformis f. sp. tritici]|uniref:Uncharacterized protein n=1 Tax=Puccinia striiformis f. sp. tritici TaxID=168172 RepID=A0ACC0EW56_9BASI|nr:hypothetical protein MJO28_001557 [Puccinia striiformis f. sp. tritici]